MKRFSIFNNFLITTLLIALFAYFVNEAKATTNGAGTFEIYGIRVDYCTCVPTVESCPAIHCKGGRADGVCVKISSVPAPCEFEIGGGNFYGIMSFSASEAYIDILTEATIEVENENTAISNFQKLTTRLGTKQEAFEWLCSKIYSLPLIVRSGDCNGNVTTTRYDSYSAELFNLLSNVAIPSLSSWDTTSIFFDDLNVGFVDIPTFSAGYDSCKYVELYHIPTGTIGYDSWIFGQIMNYRLKDQINLPDGVTIYPNPTPGCLGIGTTLTMNIGPEIYDNLPYGYSCFNNIVEIHLTNIMTGATAMICSNFGYNPQAVTITFLPFADHPELLTSYYWGYTPTLSMFMVDFRIYDRCNFVGYNITQPWWVSCGNNGNGY